LLIVLAVSFSPSAPYYKDVRFPRWLIVALLPAMALLSACNRGSHPAQTDKPAPDFTVSDGTSSIHLASYRGKVVLLNFWATWCGPCIVELPSLLQLHHDDPGLVILAVSIDEDSQAYSSFLVQRHVDLITVRDPSQSCGPRPTLSTAAASFAANSWVRRIGPARKFAPISSRFDRGQAALRPTVILWP
jgi:cytochrome c biogenesis protein CcmG/thiol:disulfide interchange protein DsbE